MNKFLVGLVVMAALPAGRLSAQLVEPIPVVGMEYSQLQLAELFKTNDIEEATYAIQLPSKGMCSAVAIAPNYLLTSDHCPRDKRTDEYGHLHPIEEWKVPVGGVPIQIHDQEGNKLQGTIVASSLYTETALIRITGVVKWLKIFTELTPGTDIKSAGFPTERQIYTTGEGVTLDQEPCVDEWQPYVTGCIGHTINTQPGWSGGGIANTQGQLVGIVHGYEVDSRGTIGLMIPGEMICEFLDKAISESDRQEIDNCN